MRLIAAKALVLACASGAVGAALLFPSQAPATTLCGENTDPCPAGATFAVPSTFEAGLAPSKVVEFKNGALAVKCAGSIMQLKTTKNLGFLGALDGELTGMSLEECAGECTEASFVNLPYTELSFQYEVMGWGVLNISASSGKKVVVRLDNCGVGYTCTYDSPSLEYNFVGGEPAEMSTIIFPPTFSKTGGPGGCALSLAYGSTVYQMAVMKMWVKKG